MKWYSKLITNQSIADEDNRRRQRILSILLFIILIFSTLNLLVYYANYLYKLWAQLPIQGGQPLTISLFTFSFFLLYKLSRSKVYRISSFGLLTFIYGGAAYTSLHWGFVNPQSLLIFALLVVMSGVLINTKAIILSLTVCVSTLLFASYAQTNGYLTPQTYWRQQPPEQKDALVYIFTLLIIAMVIWLHDREMEKALLRAHVSEKALKDERDLLEIKVEERTQELKQTQMEKMMHLYRLADFGRITAGLIHDLVTPLTQVSLELEDLKQVTAGKEVNRAIQATHRMEQFVKAIRRQIQGQEVYITFSVKKGIQEVLTVLHHKAKVNQVVLETQFHKTPKLYGNPVRFNQLLSHLISNAIDAYDAHSKNPRKVIISLTQSGSYVQLTITDYGKGIKPEDQVHIFEPFFTTKALSNGTGIGLSISKFITEKHFHGTIAFTSAHHKGTTFILKLPAPHS